MLAKLLLGFLVLLLTVSVVALVTAPATLVNRALAPKIVGDLDVWLAAQERGISAPETIIANTEKRIRWYDGVRNSKTPYAIVYLHGFSATRQEIAPVSEVVAEALGANLFETRLAGHGLSEDALVNVRAEDWLDDAAEALAIGAAIGDKVIVLGTSTGATLALAMIDHETFAKVSTIVQISPNFALKDTTSELLTWPGGPQLARMMVGDTVSWEPDNELRARYWSTRYPIDALVEMMRLVKFARAKLPLKLRQSLLTVYSPKDQVLDVARTRAALELIESPHRKEVEILTSGDPGHHVLAGAIASPQNTQQMAQLIIEFIATDRL